MLACLLAFPKRSLHAQPSGRPQYSTWHCSDTRFILSICSVQINLGTLSIYGGSLWCNTSKTQSMSNLQNLREKRAKFSSPWIPKRDRSALLAHSEAVALALYMMLDMMVQALKSQHPISILRALLDVPGTWNGH